MIWDQAGSQQKHGGGFGDRGVALNYVILAGFTPVESYFIAGQEGCSSNVCHKTDNSISLHPYAMAKLLQVISDFLPLGSYSTLRKKYAIWLKNQEEF